MIRWWLCLCFLVACEKKLTEAASREELSHRVKYWKDSRTQLCFVCNTTYEGVDQCFATVPCDQVAGALVNFYEGPLREPQP